MATSLTPAALMRAAALIENRIGIAVQTSLYGVLDDVLLTLANGDVNAYLDELESGKETDKLWQKLVDALTIGETYFLRDEEHFHLLRTHVLPELIETHRQQENLTLSIMSVGCATGEEPYSLAITLYELLPDIKNWTVQLIGVDLNSRALHTARRGVYRKWAFRHTDLDFQRSYFDPVPTGLQIKPFIQRLVTFQHTNIFASRSLPNCDLILCRNVLLYFSNKYKRLAETSFYDTLAPGGWLLLARSESIHEQPKRWIINNYADASIHKKPVRPIKPGTGILYSPKQQTGMLRTISTDKDIYQDAVLSLQSEDYDKSEQLVSGLLFKHPTHVQGLVLLASIDANRQRVMQAHARLDKAIEIEPLLADGHYLRALLHMEGGDVNAAQTSLRAALYCERNHPLASFMLGNIHAQTGKIKRATRFWENAHLAISDLEADDPISDISNTTAGQIEALVSEQLSGWIE